MIVTGEALAKLGSHWAVKSIPVDVRERADYVAQARLVRNAVGGQLRLDFVDEPNDDLVLEQVATAYELAATEGMDALLHPSKDEQSELLQAQAQAAAFKVFSYRRALPLPRDRNQLVFDVLHLAAVAYCGDRWSEIRIWLNENDESAKSITSDDTAWDRRVLYGIYECWMRLIRKRGWDDLNEVAEIVAQLRGEQQQYETVLLQQAQDTARPTAFRLIALYHWARATELLGQYMLQGEPAGILEELDRHFEAAREAGLASSDISLDMIVRWLHLASHRMVNGSIWWVTKMVNSRVTQFVGHMTQQGIFELLPPQRVALREQGLLDAAKRAIVVDLPTSGGKTALAEFRMLQALNQFMADNGWVAYVAPTRALVAQLTRRLRKALGPIGISVEQLSGALDFDSYEQELLAASDQRPFHVLVSTPEKLQLVIRNKKTDRPLALIVLDEAHNIEDEERGLRIELLLATIRRDCPQASFLLLMPYVPNAEEIANWLSPESGGAIGLGITPWRPNERIVGMFYVERGATRGEWTLRYETLTTTPGTIQLRGQHQVGSTNPLSIPYSKANGNWTIQSAAMAKVLSEKGTSIAIARTIPDSWSMARLLAKDLNEFSVIPEEIGLVQRFLQTEISPHFELIDLLAKGIGVHHAGLSDEARSLIEWLAELGSLRVLCATTTIAQGINFPVSSVFLASRFLPEFMASREMSARDFWNLAGRAGRVDQSSVGVVGIAAGSNRQDVTRFVSEKTSALVSRLLYLLDEAERLGELGNLESVMNWEQWADFRSYVAHLWSEKQDLDAVLQDTEQILRNTFGYSTLQRKRDPAAQKKAKQLLEATRNYAASLSEHPENAILADATGFAPEGVRSAILGLGGLENKLSLSDWRPESLFGAAGQTALRDLVGVMMRIPQLEKHLRDLGGRSGQQRRIAEITYSWVTGASIEQIALTYFGATPDKRENFTKAISRTCAAVYRTLANYGSWGLASLAKMPTSGLDFDKMSEEDRKRINNLAAMVYYGVKSDSAILMRMESVPRSIAEPLGDVFVRQGGRADQPDSLHQVRKFIKSLGLSEWGQVVPSGATMSGSDYRRVWSWLSGEETQ